MTAFSLQLRAQESQSCVQRVLSPQCQVWPVRLAVSPVPQVSTAEVQVSGLRLDPAAKVSPFHCSLVLLNLQKVFLVVACLIKICVFSILLLPHFHPFTLHWIVSLVSLIGFWCPPGQTEPTALPCPPGHFCSQGSTAPEPCPSGTYQDREKQAACAVCEAGRSPLYYFYLCSRSIYLYHFKTLLFSLVSVLLIRL